MTVDIDKRTLKFGVAIINFIKFLPKNTSGYCIGNQIIRSGTSIGANVEEALGAHTKSDFVYKINIAKGEARETKYWLKLISESKLLPNSTINPLLKEVDELVAILSTIVKKSKMNLKT
ncbi:MAG: four helix bundle protein [Candidatus Levybacteria bacterium CG_4_10_14_0_2_um_filter_36_16]|nr:MAG: hypothetical protein AUK12_02640 [Candidatus Levybacteria bacterium CG2_30_37_29]PIR78882.1 MAG: four helix bundle protein [Candidatus Levybacteria bacterium CG10_big_fil_rev_8_21_14_0_10_36_30]PIZ97491.1 MAG: four helix bundle protein [Candidatus Levybacteria bacterium CG_4_10_14_0_2_um_filter_36_16]PJA90120.1 MAG: four helix bundle protein [Candidatus Levybacteria bacterium CG_4_9_14_3_um_filter_36_7]